MSNLINGNYYLVQKCSVCKAMDKPVHLGKRAIGWVFLVRGRHDGRALGLPVDDVMSMSDLETLVHTMTKRGYVVVNEADQEVSSREFIDYARSTKDEKLRCPHSEVDPEGFSVNYEEFS